MKITIESTSEIVQIRTAEFADSISCRVWEGKTESGIKVQCLIPRIAALKTENLEEFERELEEKRPPSDGFRAFPLRMVI